MKQYSQQLQQLNQLVKRPEPKVYGRLVRVVGMTLEVVGLKLPIGCRCLILGDNGNSIKAEVVGFDDSTLFLMPIAQISALQPGARVCALGQEDLIPVGQQLLGRIIDGLAKPIDGKGDLSFDEAIPWQGATINPLERQPICDTMDVGIRVINSMLTVGRGQRIGLFAGSGVGKSMLLGMMTKFTEAEIVIVGLIGERGREVKEFIQHTLGEEGLKRAIIVAAPADDAPLMRLRAAELSTRLAEYYRDQGKHVLLLMDSLTRYSQAQREIALSIGEPPATKGYPPSVFAMLPKLVERAGTNADGSGSVTAFYTVLTEGDDLQDPVADSARAILDGHIVLSRQLADQGHYPAINVEGSVSRVMPSIVDQEHLKNMQQIKQWYSSYQQNKDLISVGAYTAGSDLTLDQAVAKYPDIVAFFQQGMNEPVSIDDCKQQLAQLCFIPEPEPQQLPVPG